MAFEDLISYNSIEAVDHITVRVSSVSIILVSTET